MLDPSKSRISGTIIKRENFEIHSVYSNTERIPKDSDQAVYRSHSVYRAKDIYFWLNQLIPNDFGGNSAYHPMNVKIGSEMFTFSNVTRLPHNGFLLNEI